MRKNVWMQVYVKAWCSQQLPYPSALEIAIAHTIKRAYKFPLYTLLKARTAIRSVLFPGSATVFDWCAIQGGEKMHTKLLAIILSNLNRFSKFFHGTEAGRFSNKSAVKWLLGIPLSLLQYLLSANSVRISYFFCILYYFGMLPHGVINDDNKRRLASPW